MLGIRFAFKQGLSWQELVEASKDRRVDMFSSLAVTPERSEHLVFTEPYLALPVAIFARGDVSYIGGLDELHGEKVAVNAGYAVEEWLVRDYPEINLVRVATTREALEELPQGEVFAFVGNLAATGYYLDRMAGADIKVVGSTSYEYQQTMAVRDDWPLLQSTLQKALDAMPATRHNEIQRSWLALRYEPSFDYTLFWEVLAMAAIVLSAFLY